MDVSVRMPLLFAGMALAAPVSVAFFRPAPRGGQSGTVTFVGAAAAGSAHTGALATERSASPCHTEARIAGRIDSRLLSLLRQDDLRQPRTPPGMRDRLLRVDHRCPVAPWVEGDLEQIQQIAGPARAPRSRDADD